MTDISFLSADPLAVILRRRGMSAAESFAAVEAIAMRTADGADEIESVIAVLGSCPLEYRDTVTKRQEPHPATPPGVAK